MTRSVNINAFLNTIRNSVRSLPIVILYVTEGCNLRCLTCSYRDPLPDELTLDEIGTLAQFLSDFGLKQVVYSGGEPLMRRDFPRICEIFGALNIKQTLLTNGVLLAKRYEELNRNLGEIIVSLDGATRETHNAIRGVDSFDQILKGIRKVVGDVCKPRLSIRTVIQKSNFREMEAVIRMAMDLGVDSVSFLAADVLSQSFGRKTRGYVVANEEIMLSTSETDEFRTMIRNITAYFANEIKRGFIAESPEKLLHLVEYFEGLNGRAPFPRNDCNAPMVSLVITANGNVQPCFFLPSFGNIRGNQINAIANFPEIQTTRKDVREYSLERCRTCVCTLKVSPLAALLNKI